MYVHHHMVYLASQMYSNYSKQVWWAALTWLCYKLLNQQSSQIFSTLVYILQSYCQNKKGAILYDS